MYFDIENVIMGTVAVLFIALLSGLLVCGGWSAYTYYATLNECRAKGHSRLYCTRVMDGKNIRLEDGDLDK